jgi:AmmeMemoRadiSam system protein A
MPPHCSPTLSDDDRRTLLALARRAISQVVSLNSIPDSPPLAHFADAGGAFVTLRCSGKLRGCVGRVDSADSLAEIVAQSAITAAIADPRFKPLSALEISAPDNLDKLDIEISVTSQPFEIEPGEFRLGIHGIIVVSGANRGLLLPQVAGEHSWSRDEFFDAACRKAGLRAGAWRNPETRLFAFTAEVFSESGLLPVGQGQSVDTPSELFPST